MSTPTSIITNTLTYINNFRFVPGKTPFSHWSVPAIVSTLYIIVVFGIKFLMSKREKGFKMRTISIIHNAIMTFLSVAMYVGMLVSFLSMWKRHSFSLEVIFCDAAKREVNRGPLYFWVYLFYLSKIYELFDTVILVLKKRPLKFLHVYHHWITLTLVWVCLTTELPVQWSAEILNAWVHCPMYYYYTLVSINPLRKVSWKKYITQMQITQFILVILLHSYSFYYHYGISRKCSSFNTWGNEFGMFVIASYLVLFLIFYKETYPSKKHEKGKQE